MAKYEEVEQKNEDIFLDFIAEAKLEHLIQIKVLADNSQKKVCEIKKVSPLMKFMTNEDVVIIINEDIYNGLEDNQKRLVADEYTTQISFDYEKDRVIITKPTLTTFPSIMDKYTFPIYIRVDETIKALYEAKNNPEANV